MTALTKALNCLLLASLTCTLAAADYYWVGGGGDWSDLSHWSTTSGGDIQHNQIPSADDRVIFDANSFSNANEVVRLNLDIVFTGDLDFSQIDEAVRLTGDNHGIISVHGGMRLHPQLTLDFDGQFDFKGIGNDLDLEWFGQQPKRINFLGSGSYVLKTDLTVDSLIRIEFGSLRFDDVMISCKRFEVFGTTALQIDFGAADLLITGNRTREMNNYRWRESLHFEGEGITSIPGTARIRLPGKRSSIGIWRNQESIHLPTVALGSENSRNLMFADWVGDHTFSKLHALGNTRFEGFFGFDSLEVEGGNVYAFRANSTQKIGVITANTDCGRTAYLRSLDGGVPVTIEAQQSNQTLSHVLIQDIKVTGATYQALEAIDLGGNTGWNITQKSSETFYWIGRSGLWNDPNNWSFSSGGAPSGCLPTAADDVIFDENSFSAAGQIVTVNIPIAFCRSMDWRQVNQNCRLVDLPLANRTTIRIFGSLWFSNLLSNDFDGDIYFASPTSGNEILTAGIEINRNAYFTSAAGEWRLLDKFDVNDSLFFSAGTLHTDDHEVECFQFFSRTESPRNLHLGNSVFRVVRSTHHMYHHSRFEISALNMQVFPGQSKLIFENDCNPDFYRMGNLSFYYVEFRGAGGYYIRDAEVTIAHALFYHDAFFNGRITIDTMRLSPTKKYTFFHEAEIEIDSLEAKGTCDGTIYIGAEPKNAKGTFIKQSGEVHTSRVTLEGITGTGGAIFNALSSVDFGDNQGWNFTALGPRTLYWINGSGSWFDRQHWSLSSGGGGGECVPTVIDDVIFDNSSFNNAGEFINLGTSEAAIAHNMTWTDVPDFVGINDGTLNLSGSLTLEETINFYPWNLVMRSDSTNNEIFAADNEINWVQFMGAGAWTLTDDLKVTSRIFLQEGTFATDGYTLETGQLYLGSYPLDLPKRLEFSNSHIKLNALSYFREQLHVAGENFTFDPGSSLIEFIGSDAAITHYGNTDITLHNVLFSDPQGESRINQYDNGNILANKIQFNNSGYILNSNRIDSLLLAAGKEYTLESGATQYVQDYLLAIGNNCTPISIKSTNPGQQATLESDNARITADFVQMQDQHAQGSANFSAGANSSDISNNTGWTFEPTPDHIEVGFLGADRALCRGSSLELNAYNYSPGETYLWQDGSSDSTFAAATSGKYWSRVTFANNCVVTDTVIVLDPLDLQVDLGPDTTICEGDFLELDGSNALAETVYLWQDSSDEPTYQVSDSGQYHLTIAVQGCQYSDTVLVSVQPLPDLDVAGNSGVCLGDTVLLDATSPGGAYVWNDGSTAPQLAVTSDGNYWVEVTAAGCQKTDTIDIAFAERPDLTLGPDTALCKGEVLDLALSLDQVTYLWSNGETSSATSFTEAGQYWVEVSRAACRISDTIAISLKDLPTFSLGADQAICPGDSFSLMPDTLRGDLTWHDQSSSPRLIGQLPGTYFLQMEDNGCTFSDTILVSLRSNIDLVLGPDTTVCDNRPFFINAEHPDVLTYQWQNGVTEAIIDITEPGLYQLTANDGFCDFTEEVQIEFRSCKFFEAYLPNAFTPNGDGNNDDFRPYFDSEILIDDYTLQVFNRWGDLVFTSSQPEEAWFGDFNNEPLEAGAFVFRIYISYVDDDGPGTFSKSGSITLLR